MKRFQRISALLLPALLSGTVFAHAAKTAARQPALVKMVDSTGLVQLQAPDFNRLNPQQKLLAYWLSQAAIAIDPIIYDQLSPYGAELKTLLEGIAAHRDRLPAEPAPQGDGVYRPVLGQPQQLQQHHLP